MEENLIAKVSIVVSTSRARVWEALVNPEAIKQYMFGTTVISDWHRGSPIIWKGEWQGNSYEDKGVILQFKPEHIIQYSHFSPLSGLPDHQETTTPSQLSCPTKTIRHSYYCLRTRMQTKKNALILKRIGE